MNMIYEVYMYNKNAYINKIPVQMPGHLCLPHQTSPTILLFTSSFLKATSLSLIYAILFSKAAFVAIALTRFRYSLFFWEMFEGRFVGF